MRQRILDEKNERDVARALDTDDEVVSNLDHFQAECQLTAGRLRPVEPVHDDQVAHPDPGRPEVGH